MAIRVFIGFIGSGKTCAAARFAYRALKNGQTVYHNIPDLTLGEYVPSYLIGFIDLSNCLYILDEAGIDFNNRLSLAKMLPSKSGSTVDKSCKPSAAPKGMTQECIRFLKLSGHYKCDFIVFSQAQDFDVTIRRLAVKLYIINKRLPWVSSYFRLTPKWVTDSNTGDPRTEWVRVPLSTRFIWLPRWWKLFDRYNPPKLPAPEFPYPRE